MQPNTPDRYNNHIHNHSPDNTTHLTHINTLHYPLCYLVLIIFANRLASMLNILEHWITKGYWEYYITDEKFSDDIVAALVMGYETEIGDISKAEIRPYIITKTDDLDGVLPPPGWQWVEV